jgi:hypothetical protein
MAMELVSLDTLLVAGAVSIAILLSSHPVITIILGDKGGGNPGRGQRQNLNPGPQF